MQRAHNLFSMQRGHNLSSMQWQTYYADRMRLRAVAEQLKQFCPLLSDVDVIVGNLFSTDRGFCRAYSYVLSLISEDLKYFKIDLNNETKKTIETSPNSTYRFKKSETSFWECNREDDEIKFDDDDFVNDTYYAIVKAEDIPKFIEDSGKMINGKDQIDPLDDGKFHAAEVYVISDEVLPFGLEELVRREKTSRNMTLHFVVGEAEAKEFIEKQRSFDLLLPLYDP